MRFLFIRGIFGLLAWLHYFHSTGSSTKLKIQHIFHSTTSSSSHSLVASGFRLILFTNWASGDDGGLDSVMTA